MKDFLEAQVSPATRRNYKFGLKTFAEWYKRPVQELLREKDPGRVLERYWVWLKENYKGNTPRSKLNAVIQYCRYNRVDPEIRKGLHVYKQIDSVRDHDLTIEECRRMYR